MRIHPSKSELRYLFDYDETDKSFVFTYKVPVSNCHSGSRAGTETNRNSVSVKIDYQLCSLHRLVWIWYNGDIPRGYEIDHINRNPMDNRISNLRCVTKKINARNKGKQKNNTSGVTGVYYRKSSDSWRSRVRVDGKLISLGTFPTIEEAALCISNFKREQGGWIL